MQVWCCWQVTLCDPHLSALEVRFSRRGAIQIDVYLYQHNKVNVVCSTLIRLQSASHTDCELSPMLRIIRGYMKPNPNHNP